MAQNLRFRLPWVFEDGNLPQSDFELLDFCRNIRRLEAAQMDGQVHQVQTETHLIECFFIHSTEIGWNPGSR